MLVGKHNPSHFDLITNPLHPPIFPPQMRHVILLQSRLLGYFNVHKPFAFFLVMGETQRCAYIHSEALCIPLSFQFHLSSQGLDKV